MFKTSIKLVTLALAYAKAREVYYTMDFVDGAALDAACDRMYAAREKLLEEAARMTPLNASRCFPHAPTPSAVKKPVAKKPAAKKPAAKKTAAKKPEAKKTLKLKPAAKK